jgi:hypothetical protein
VTSAPPGTGLEAGPEPQATPAVCADRELGVLELVPSGSGLLAQPGGFESLFTAPPNKTKAVTAGGPSERAQFGDDLFAHDPNLFPQIG